MTGWEPKGNESSFPVWKPEPAKEIDRKTPTFSPQNYWPFPKVDIDLSTDE